jgi:hypothetical protein
MTTFGSHQLPVLIIPRLSHPSICTPTHRIKNHHRHHTWRLPYSLPHLLSNTQDQTRRHYLLHTPTNAQRQTTNAQRQTHNPLTILAPLKMQRGQTAHLLNHRKPTAMAAKQAIHAPPRRPQNELTLLQPHSPALRIIQKCPSANAAATETTKATKTPTTTSKQTEREGGLWH